MALLANPTGGSVVQGAASIAGGAGLLTVNQSTGRAVINWQSFSIAAGESTQFFVPTGGATLNRVTGSNLSAIYGTLTSNGQLFLINPNGVIFGAGSVINTAGLVASTLDVADSQFMAGGNLTFSGNSSGSVQNLGTITATGGDVHLIAQHVENDGTISAINGTVGLAGGNQVLLQPAGQQKLFVQPAGTQGTVVNAGTINAVTAELKADSGNVYALAINNTGTIRATGSATVNGHVYLIASGGGAVQSTGTLVAKNQDGKGGTIETSGQNVQVSGTVLTGTGGSWLIDPLVIDNGTDIDIATLEGQLNGGNISETAISDIDLNEALTWTGTGVLTLSSGGTIELGGAVTATSGGLILTAGSGSPITATAAMNVASFKLTNGNWVQNASGGSLPTFNVTNFTLSGGTFLRVLNGAGTSGNPYQLADVYGLQGINGFLSSDFELANSIDASGTANWNSGAGFVPIGNGGAAYTGTFNSQGYTINGLMIDQPSASYIGLFGNVGSGGIVEEVGVTNVNVRGEYEVGGLVGINSGTVEMSYSTGSVTCTNSAGGLVGANDGTVETCYSTAAVTGSYDVGGLMGANSGTVETCYSTGSVTGQTYVGGLVGENYATVETSYSTGSVTGISSGYDLGGLVGVNRDTVEMSYSTGAVIGGEGAQLGGLAGENTGTVETSYSTGAVSGNFDSSCVGGLVGFNNGGVINNSYSAGAVSGGSQVGGLVGNNDGGTVETNYSTGSVTAGANSSSIGGLVGENYGGTVETSYSTGSVTTGGSSYYIGGLIGFNNGTVENCYWDNTTSGQASGIGDDVGTTTNLTPLTSSTAYSASSYGNLGTWTQIAGDYYETSDGTWFMVNGSTRPFLVSEYSTTITNAHQLQLVDLHLGATYTLASNISLAELSNASGMWNTSTGFSPIGDFSSSYSSSYASTEFTGTFNGAAYTIDGLTINRPGSEYVGLFGYVGSSGSVQEVGVTNVNIGGGDEEVGGLVGENDGLVETSYSTGSVTGSFAEVGGLVGENDGTVGTSYSTGSVSGSELVGGLVGLNYGTVEASYSTGSVSGYQFAGGLVGENAHTVENCYWDSTTSGQASGVGVSSGGTVTNVLAFTSATPLTAANFSNLGDFTVGSGTWGVNQSTGTGLINSGLPYFQWEHPYLILTADDQAVTYGSAANTTAILGTTYSVSGLRTADTLASVLASGPALSVNGTNTHVSSTNAIDLAATLSASNGIYVLNVVAGTESFTPAPVTVTIGNNSNVYGTAPDLSGVSVSASGLQNGDAVAALATALATTATAATHVGTTPSITGTSTDADYSYSYVTGTESVTPAPLTVVVGAATSTYGSTPVVSGVTYTPNGLHNGDLVGALALTAATTATATTDAGTYTGAITASSTDADYSITYTNGTLTINPAHITVTAVGGTSTYGDSPSNPGLNAAGLVNGQSATVLTGLSNSFGITNASNANSYTLSVDGTLTNGNYTVDSTADGIWTVNPAHITVTALGGTSTYGDSPSNPGLSATGLVNGQSVGVLSGLSNSFGISNISNATSYTLSVDGTLTNGNYTVDSTTDGTWTVNPAHITVTALGGASTYGDSSSNPGLSATGLVNGQSVGVLSGLSNSFGISNTSNAASFTLTVDGSLTNGNYTVDSTANGTWTVNAAPLTYQVNSSQKAQGAANPNFAGTWSGFVLGQDAGVLTGTLAYTTTATVASPAGNYAVNAGGLLDANYQITYLPGELTIGVTAPLSFFPSSLEMMAQLSSAIAQVDAPTYPQTASELKNKPVLRSLDQSLLSYSGGTGPAAPSSLDYVSLTGWNSGPSLVHHSSWDFIQ